MNILITGGSGFIGTHLLEALASCDAIEHIAVIDLEPPRYSHCKLTYLKADIRNRIETPLPFSVDICFHLAALCKEPGYEWEEYFATNYTGTRHVCDYLSANNVRKLIFTSTMMVFRAGDQRMSEESPTCPDTAYGISKLAAEIVVEAWTAADRTRVLRICRPGVVFGRGENGNYTRLYYALKKRRFMFIGRDTTIKSSIYVKDLVAALLFLNDYSGPFQTFNAVWPEPTSIRDITEAFKHVFRFRVSIPTIPFRVALAGGYAGEFLSSLGFKTPLHHRRIEKLYYSTNLSADRLVSAGFRFQYDIAAALMHWRAECASENIY